jgi:DnaJ-class molecular chaperone
MIGLIPRGYEGYDVEDCPDCDGSGQVVGSAPHRMRPRRPQDRADRGGGGVAFSSVEECETCDGEGVVAV